MSSFQSSVDIFDVLYIIKCMQSAGTLMVGFGIIVVDLAQNCIALYLLAKQTKSLRAVSARIASSSSQDPNNILPLVFGLLDKSQHLSSDSLRFTSR